MIPIKDALGCRIKCPDNHCGHAAPVNHARGRVSSNPQSAAIQTAALWYVVDCPKSGKKLYKHDTPVEVIQ